MLNCNYKKRRDFMINFTEKEYEVLRYLITGLNNKEISKKMFVTNHTVKAHISSILHKLNVSNRTEAVYVVLTNNLLD